MRLLSTATCVLLSAPFLLPPGASSAVSFQGPPPDPLTDPDPLQVCATGCSAATAGTSALSPREYERLLEDFAGEPADGRSAALEALLFHGAQTLALLDGRGTGALDGTRAQLLRRELTRTHAWLDVRLIDDEGVERLRLGRRRIPLGRKQHLWPRHTRDLQPPEISGTVRRVGLRHLWARL
jgi:hypothetical protein